MTGNDANVESHKVSDDPVTYQTTNMPSDWQLSGSNLANASIGMIPMHNSMVESSPSCSSGPIVVDSFCPPIWDMNGQSLGYCDVQNVAGTSSGLNPVRAGMGWNLNAAMLRGGGVLPYMVPGMLSQSLPQLPADSGFIERAARFSCFSGGNLGEMMNPFGLPDPYSRSLGQMQGPHEVGGGNGPKLVEMNGNNALNEMSLQGLCGTEGSPYENEKRTESEGKNGANSSGNESDEAEFSGRGGQDGVPGGSSGKRLGAKKRKRNVQDITEHDKSNEASQLSMEKVKDTSEVDKQKDDQNPTSTGKPGGKNGKQGSQGSDVPKEDYIHIRARRGQATNSHSLAERVRREKISERMKFLQDLVPGCSKVTGKAVMLDEIINYVQSLQRQVEFLSMKLATVNPRLDFNNIEGLLAKDILQSRAGFPSSMGFHPDMTVPFPSPHPSQTGLLQTGLPGLGSSTELLRRPINIQSNALCGGFKEHAAQVSSAWEDELNNIVHMGFNPTAAHRSQDLSASQPQRNMKAEP